MTRLDACYFCGDIGESLTRYDVVPASLDPSEDEQRTVVLCPRCHRKLEPVLEPFVERLDGFGAGTGGESEPTSIEIETGGDEDSPVTNDGSDAETVGSAAAESTDCSDDGEPTDCGDGPTDRDDDGGPTDRDDGGPTDRVDDGDEPTDDGVAIPDVNDDAAVGPDESDGDGEADESGAGDADGTERAESESADETARADAAAPAPPSGYHKVMRLLRNRELPMARSAAEELASSAYDMGAARASEIVDAAIERGVLVEEGGQIRRA